MTGSTNTGGAGLNLRVIGNNTQPENPTENMIWFNTDTRIPHWYFQNDAPSSPSLGDVYITISTTATNVLQVLRNNGMKVYFGTSRQWDGAAWNIIGGKIYYSGSWHNLQTFVYDGTIGDAENNFNHSVGGYPWQMGGEAAKSISTTTDSFSCSFGAGTGGNGVIYTKDKIDFSAVNSVKITYTCTGTDYLWAKVFTSRSGGTPSGTVVSSGTINSASAKTTVTLDVTNVSGEYYLGFHAYSNKSGYQWGKTIKVFSIELIS